MSIKLLICTGKPLKQNLDADYFKVICRPLLDFKLEQDHRFAHCTGIQVESNEVTKFFFIIIESLGYFLDT